MSSFLFHTTRAGFAAFIWRSPECCGHGLCVVLLRLGCNDSLMSSVLALLSASIALSVRPHPGATPALSSVALKAKQVLTSFRGHPVFIPSRGRFPSQDISTEFLSGHEKLRESSNSSADLSTSRCCQVLKHLTGRRCQGSPLLPRACLDTSAAPEAKQLLAKGPTCSP